MNVIIETRRLLLSEFTMDDAPLLLELNKDPDVTRFTGDPILDLTQATQLLEQVIIPQYRLYRHGRWAVYNKAKNDFIGWCGLKFVSERREIDLGYRFMKNAWGKGYATESAFASIQYGFSKLNLERIVGRAVPENLASIKVMEKCGMSYIRTEKIEGHTARTYHIFRPLIH